MRYQDYLYRNKLHRIEGDEGVKNLETLVETLGYARTGFKYGDPISQFLADNPGAIEAIHEWIEGIMPSEWAESLGLNEDSEEESEEENT